MKALYIAEKIKTVSGGNLTNKRNLCVLKNSIGEDNVFEYYIKYKKMSNIKRVINEICHSTIYSLTSEDISKIENIIRGQQINIVFFDNSNFGNLCAYIKGKYDVFTIVFFHNVEYELIKGLYKTTKNLKFLYRKYISYRNEMKACLYADKIISLNLRDATTIESLYKRIPDHLIPISLPDDKKADNYEQQNHKLPVALFVGSFFPPNVEGVEWFVKNVLPKVKIKFVVIGSGMDNLKEQYKNITNMEIHGYVEDLQQFYANADFMVMPIFSGSGMKVKTAEALKYGKYLIASNEALVGYDVTQNEAASCDTAEDFINAINNYDAAKFPNGFIPSSRNLFLEKYSYESSYKSFKQIIDAL